MPLINGCKYSCEPCIRGHRATSCAHTDRALVEVRKPGRPLRSCGHRLDTCVCGRLNEYLKIDDILSDLSDSQAGQNLQIPLIVAAQPRPISPVAKSKQRSCSNSTSKVSKRPKKKVVSQSPVEAASTESATLYEDQQENPSTQTPYIDPQYVPRYFSPTDYSPNVGSRTPSITSNTPLPRIQNFLQSQNNPYAERPWESQSSPPQYRPPMGYSSRIEDVSLISNGGSTRLNPAAPEPLKVVRSQYIMTTQDPAGTSTYEKQ